MPRFATASIALAAALSGAAPAHADNVGNPAGERNLINGATAQAAFQIAIWQIARDTSASSSAGAGALALARDWLGDPSRSGPNGYPVSTLDGVGDPDHQDVVFAAAVPEPSTYALLAGGLLAIGLVSRRRAATARR